MWHHFNTVVWRSGCRKMHIYHVSEDEPILKTTWRAWHANEATRITAGSSTTFYTLICIRTLSTSRRTLFCPRLELPGTFKNEAFAVLNSSWCCNTATPPSPPAFCLEWGKNHRLLFSVCAGIAKMWQRASSTCCSSHRGPVISAKSFQETVV